MSEGSDYVAASWVRGHDFGSARRTYDDVVVSRSYGRARKAGKTALDLVEPSIVSQAKRTLILMTDHTGSMGKRTGIIASKYPYLVNETFEYLGKDTDFCIGVIGDAKGDTYPLEVRSLAKDRGEVEARYNELVIEGGGGEGGTESYELAALYFCRNASFPKALHKPILIMTGDESPKALVTPEQASEYAHVTLESDISAKAIFEELQEKFIVYYILNPYMTPEDVVVERLDGTSEQYYRKWCALLDAEHVVILTDPKRIVDVIYGIMAKETDKLGYFRDEIEDRQDPDQIEATYKALKTIHALPAPDDKSAKKTGASKLRTKGSGPKTKSLM